MTAPFRYPAQVTKLPVFAHRQNIRDAIKNNQVLIISASTGSGKSTLIPLLIVDFLKSDVFCSETRRASATGLSMSVSKMKIDGVRVGYHIKYDNHSQGCNIIFMTEGKLIFNLISRHSPEPIH